MAKFEKSKDNSKDKPSKPTTLSKIVEPRCNVCMHKERDRIDYLLAMKTPYRELERIFEADRIDHRSFSTHDKKHLQYESEAIKRIIEHEAGLAQENLAEGVRGAFLRRSALDVSIKKFFDAVMAGEIVIEAKDLAKMVELREKLDSDTAAAQIQQYEVQFNAFKQALEEVCPPEMLQTILDRTKELLMVGDRPALQQGD
jgi:hypothetical protein